jgi:hypothetical protein
LANRPVDWSLGPILAGGLTLAHHECLAACSSLPALRARLDDQWPAHGEFGVHVLVSQHDRGELVLGDSHEYDDAITTFDKPAIDALILGYLRTCVEAGDFSIVERWHGMTLSFGLAQQLVSEALG